MPLKRFKTISFAYILLTFVIAGCAPSKHTFCRSIEQKPCLLPEPPYRASEKTPIPPKRQNLDLGQQRIQYDVQGHSAEGTATINERRKIEVIEIIRYSTHKSAAVAKQPAPANRYLKRTEQPYTIQLGAYQKESSRMAVIDKFPASAPLYVFPMKNSWLGLSYGAFHTRNQAHIHTQKLKEQGFTDLLIRKSPIKATKL